MEAANLSDAEKVTAIKALLDQRKTRDFDQLKDDLENTAKDASWNDILEARSLRLQNRLSSVLRALTFMPNKRAAALLEAIDHFKNDGELSITRAPLGFLDADQKLAVIRADDTFRVSLYKVFLFHAVTIAIKSGDLNVEQSYKYRPMDAYLINKERWQREKPLLLERAGLSEFANSEPVLEKLSVALSTQYQATNTHAAANPHLKIRKDGTFHIATPALDDRESDPLGDLFPQRHDVPLAQVLETVNNHCNMLTAFEHWQQTHARQATSHPALLAGIMGLGCGIGVRKMARISSSVTESELDHTVNWRFSIDNIRAANDAVVKAMDAMELPNLYRQNQEQLHTASDGQKFEVRGDSLHASRSFKYFGQGQGISAYTFVDERNFLWHSLMISAADRESAYVIDGLMHNDVVKSDIHSTDTHGYTEAVFGLTHLLGFSFAPRIKGSANRPSISSNRKGRRAKTGQFNLTKPSTKPSFVKTGTICSGWLPPSSSRKTRLPMSFGGSIHTRDSTPFIRHSRLSVRSSNPCSSCATLTTWHCVKPSKNSSTRLSWPTALPAPWP